MSALVVSWYLWRFSEMCVGVWKAEATFLELRSWQKFKFTILSDEMMGHSFK